jgi:hypothetical protein
VAGAVRERAEAVSEELVARPAVAGDLPLAGLDRDRGLAGVAGECVRGGVAGAAVADLGQQLGGADDRVGVAEQRAEDLAVRMVRNAVAICAREIALSRSANRPIGPGQKRSSSGAQLVRQRHARAQQVLPRTTQSPHRLV